MSPATVTRRNRLWLLALPAALLLVSGCVPALWLPDSSGFLYVTRDRVAILYDVKSGKKQVIVRELPANTPWPALSPEGKRFAVARLAPQDAGKQFEVQIIVYDLKGKEVHRSPLFPWQEFDDRDVHATGVFWARTREKLIVQDFHDEGQVGIYDLEKKTLIKVEGIPAPFGGTPLAPDDKGFLVTREEDREPKLGMFLVGWDGKEQPIKVDEEINKEEDTMNVVRSPWTGTSWWEENTAFVSYKKWQVRVNTEKKTARLGKAPDDPLDVGPLPVIQRFDFPGAGARLRVVLKEKENLKDTQLLKLLLWKPGAKKPEQVFEVKNGSLILSPSPDGKWLVVRALGDDLKEFDFLLTGKDGEVRNRPEN